MRSNFWERRGGVAVRRDNVDRGRPPVHRRRPFENIVVDAGLAGLQPEIGGRHVAVVGSAPLPKALRIPDAHYVIVVNGAVSSVPFRVPNLWVVNSRIKPMEHWSRERRFLHTEMMRQAAKRHVETVAFLTRQEQAEHYTATWLREQGTTYDRGIVISRHDRERLEVQSGARTIAMKKDATSAGIFAGILALWAHAATVTFYGISFGLGYHYLPGRKMPLNARAHVQGDRLALRELRQKYPGRVFGTIVEPTREQRAS